MDKTSIISYVLLTILTLMFLFPIIWLILASFKTPLEVWSWPPDLLPKNPVNFIYNVQFALGYAITKGMMDSLIIAISTTVLTIALSVLAAYGIVRFRTGGSTVPSLFLFSRMLPTVAIILPIYVMFQQLHMLDTYFPLILMDTLANMALATWLLIGFIGGIPEDLDKAAMVDGLSRRGAFLRVIIPSAAPGIAVAAMFTFIFSWNDYFLGSLLTTTNVRPMSVQLAGLVSMVTSSPSNRALGSIFLISLLSILPAVVLVFILQKYLVKGLNLGSVT